MKDTIAADVFPNKNDSNYDRSKKQTIWAVMVIFNVKRNDQESIFQADMIDAINGFRIRDASYILESV